MRKCFLAALSALVLTVPATTSAQIALPGCVRPATLAAPFVFVAVNGQCTDLSAFVAPVVGGKGWSISAQLSLAGATIDLHALFNPDPSVTFGGTTTNTTAAATTYAFLFGLPIVPDFYSSALSTLHLSATSVTGTTTVANSTTYPTFVAGYGSVGDELTNLGVDLGQGTCVASGTGGSAACDLGSASSSFAPTFYDNLEALVTYTQDNTGSTVTFSGEVAVSSANVVTTTPEPATLALVGIGLFALGGTITKRQRRLD
jgi:PEP-CTERM motif-containing protein